MQIIQKAANIINLTIGEQKINTTLNYRKLKFSLFANHKDGVLLFNNLTKELLLLSETEAAVLKSDIFKIDTDFLLMLAKKWFLVPIESDDVKLCTQIVSIKRQLLSIENVINNFTILTTTACNARCFYCIEAGAKPIVMDEKTALDIAKFIVEKSKGKEVELFWFGGEPLCNQKVINIIVNYLIDNNIKYHSIMTSNGYLFDENLAKTASEKWLLKNVQITLDGTEEIYNKVKNYVYKNVDSPFKRVISNIEILLQNKIPVSVRLNMDKHNSRDLFDLVDFLYQKFNGKKGFYIYANLLFENTGFEKFTRTNNERNKIGETFIALCEYIKNKGLWAHKSALKNDVQAFRCMADNPKAIVIMPDGSLGRCEGCLDNFVGNIYTGYDKEVWSDYYELLGKCLECPCYPECMPLKKCLSCHEGCYEFEQTEKIMRLKDLIKRHYNNYLISNGG